MYHGPDFKAVMEPPLHVFVRFLKSQSRVMVHLNDNAKLVMEGTLLGFDEYMNLVLGDAYEIYPKTDTRVSVGKILLRGETIGFVYEKPDTKYV